MNRTSSFEDRHDAGQQLAKALMHLKSENPIVLALPRGGVPVGYEVARELESALDVLLVRKIGAPGFPELGIGAVVDGRPPQRVLNESVVNQISPPAGYVEEEEMRQIREIERRRQRYCGGRPSPDVSGRTVIVVDDGIATGGTMRAALKGLAQADVRRLVFAVPVAPVDVIRDLRAGPAEGICLAMPEPFTAVGVHYANFEQTSDEEVIALLAASGQDRLR